MTVPCSRHLRHNASRLVALPAALFVFLTLPALQPVTRCQEQDRPALRTINDVFSDVAARVPAFGGMFVDEDKDTLYVYMVPGQTGDVRAIDQAISDVFETERPPERRLQILPGQHTFSQLREWDDRVGLRVLMVPGAVQSAIDHARNRLEVGVTSEAAVAGVEQALAAAKYRATRSS